METYSAQRGFGAQTVLRRLQSGNDTGQNRNTTSGFVNSISSAFASSSTSANTHVIAGNTEVSDDEKMACLDISSVQLLTHALERGGFLSSTRHGAFAGENESGRFRQKVSDGRVDTLRSRGTYQVGRSSAGGARIALRPLSRYEAALASTLYKLSMSVTALHVSWWVHSQCHGDPSGRVLGVGSGC